MTTPKPKPGQIEIRDSRTQKLVCRYDPQTGEVEVSQRGEVRRGTLPAPKPAIGTREGVAGS